MLHSFLIPEILSSQANPNFTVLNPLRSAHCRFDRNESPAWFNVLPEAQRCKKISLWFRPKSNDPAVSIVRSPLNQKPQKKDQRPQNPATLHSTLICCSGIVLFSLSWWAGNLEIIDCSPPPQNVATWFSMLQNR